MCFRLDLEAGDELNWSVRNLPLMPKLGWEPGFPYFGEAAEYLATWGLYSRGRFRQALQGQCAVELGDRLRHRIDQRGRLVRLFIADLSNRWMHCLVLKTRDSGSFDLQDQ